MTQSNYIRETEYAGVIREGIFEFEDGQEIRMEKLHIKNTGTEEIRFSWWKDGKFITRPMHATEEQLLGLFSDGIRKGVFTPDFRRSLRQIL